MAGKDSKARYLIQKSGGDFVIELPDSWRLTFAHVNPSAPERGMGGSSGHCVRVYDGKKLKAVFAGCTGFRDLGIPLARKFEKETGSAEWSRDSDGSFDEHRTVKVERHLQSENGEVEDEEVPF